MPADMTCIHNLLIDMDGVLYRGKTGLPGGPELLAFLRAQGIRLLLVTNNSTLTPAQFVVRLGGMGLEVCETEIVTSGVATANYLAEVAPTGARVNVVGEQALVDELEKRGLVVTTGRDCEYVVAGLDKTLTYDKLMTACLAIRAGATFVGTNADTTYPLEQELIPGAGSILAALIAATDTQPFVIGKPEPVILDQSMHILGARPEETAILGDRLETDILGGYRANIATMMVLTGISTAEETAAYEIQPDFLYDDLPALLTAWQDALDRAPRRTPAVD